MFNNTWYSLLAVLIVHLLCGCASGCPFTNNFLYDLTPQMQPVSSTVSDIITLETPTDTVCVVKCMQNSDCKVARYVNSLTCTLMSEVTVITLEPCTTCTTITITREHLLYRNTRGSGVGVYDTFSSEDDVNNEFASAYKTVANDPGGVFKSDLATDAIWSRFTKIRLSLYENSLEVFYILFDNVGASRMNWFSRSRILESTASDLTPTSSSEYFSIQGYDIVNAKRRFYIISHGTCSGDHGWLSVTDVGFTADRCPVELGVLPVFLHSSSGADQNLQDMTSSPVLAILGIH